MSSHGICYSGYSHDATLYFLITSLFSPGKDIRAWFAELAVDMDKIQEITKQLLALYDLWKAYDEKKEINSILQKMPKPILKQN